MIAKIPRVLAGALAAALLAAAVLPRSARAAEKDYYFPEVRIEVAVERDGSFLVDEFRTFEFQGKFSYAFVVVPLRVERQGVAREVSVSEFAVTDEQGSPLVTGIENDGERLTAKWFFTARDERRTFHIRYRVTGGITSYPDVTELYWQVIGDGWDKPAQNVRATVVLPEPVASQEDLRVWGHGPLSGWAEVVDQRTARFSSPELGSGQFFEVRVVWPSGIVSGVPSNRLTLEDIKTEEEGFVRGTIERVESARAEIGRREAERKRKLLKGVSVWGVWQIAGPLLWLIVFLRVWSSKGKDYRFAGIPDYVREPPSDLPPAIVQTLMREGRTVTPAAFTATLFDLARRKVLEMDDRNVTKKGLFGSKDAVETSITLKEDLAGAGGLKPFERSLLAFLFEEAMGAGPLKGASFTVDGLQKFLKKKPQKFQAWYHKWTRAVRDEAAALGFLEPESLRARNIFYAASVPAGILTLSPVLLILSLALIPSLKRRTMAWARQNEDWKGLKRFLDDFSDFKEIPAEAYKLWEHYLVYGILFGNAKKILKMLPVILQDERAVAPVWYAGLAHDGLGQAGNLAVMDLSHVISSIEHTAMAIQDASTSAAHYSSGGGGGFSGGAGGGGGGRRGRRGRRLMGTHAVRFLSFPTVLGVCLLLFACGRPSAEARIREVLKESAARAETRDLAGFMDFLSDDYIDGEGRDKAGAERLLSGYLDRFRGIVVHVLGARVADAGPGRPDRGRIRGRPLARRRRGPAQAHPRHRRILPVRGRAPAGRPRRVAVYLRGLGTAGARRSLSGIARDP
ncbi:MAG: DUF2207 domain-containing protein [Candidatus Moduliflexus flocculans]|nr:DUF2207 domain-containing protein [Candidatus Moduliflexus flocculans]